MHIAEGVAPGSVVAGGAMLAAAGVAAGLRTLDDEQIPRAALVSAVIFVSTVVLRLPLGPSSVHPVLNGLAGLLLGWSAVPAFLVCLFLQALLFQFGGVTTLGINTVVMGLPAVAVYYLFAGPLRRTGSHGVAFALGAAAAAVALALSFCLWSAVLLLSGVGFVSIVKLALIPQLGLIAVEAGLTGFAAAFLARVYPQAFEMPRLLGEPSP